MAAVTYYVALAFMRSEDSGDIVACDPKEARGSDLAIRMAGSLVEGHCGAIAFSRTGDRALGDIADALILTLNVRSNVVTVRAMTSCWSRRPTPRPITSTRATATSYP